MAEKAGDCCCYAAPGVTQLMQDGFVSSLLDKRASMLQVQEGGVVKGHDYDLHMQIKMEDTPFCQDNWILMPQQLLS